MLLAESADMSGERLGGQAMRLLVSPELPQRPRVAHLRLQHQCVPWPEDREQVAQTLGLPFLRLVVPPQRVQVTREVVHCAEALPVGSLEFRLPSPNLQIDLVRLLEPSQDAQVECEIAGGALGIDLVRSVQTSHATPCFEVDLISPAKSPAEAQIRTEPVGGEECLWVVDAELSARALEVVLAELGGRSVVSQAAQGVRQDPGDVEHQIVVGAVSVQPDAQRDLRQPLSALVLSRLV